MVILAEYACPSANVLVVGLHTTVGVPTPDVLELVFAGEFPVACGVKVIATEVISIGEVFGN